MYFSLVMYLQSMFFWFYMLLLAIYLRNLTYLFIMVWIHMDAHGYICIFWKYECFMYVCSTGFLIRFVSRFLSGSGLVPVPRVDRFDHRFGSDNIDEDYDLVKPLYYPLIRSTIVAITEIGSKSARQKSQSFESDWEKIGKYKKIFFIDIQNNHVHILQYINRCPKYINSHP